MQPDRYMVYLLIDPRDLVPFYAGMTSRPAQRWYAHNTDRISAAYERLGELRAQALKCRVRILARDLTYNEARKVERQIIDEHRPTLLNFQLHRRGRSAV